MFVTRATRHDKDDIKALLEAEEWDTNLLDKGTAYIARDGAVVGTARLIEVGPQTVVVEDVLVRKDRRGEGVGRRVLEAAMMAKGGTLYLCCHDDVIPYYEKLGFATVEFDDLPESVNAWMKEQDCLPHHVITDEKTGEKQDHHHFYMKAR